MININPEIVCQLITRVRAFHAKEGSTFTESGMDVAFEIDPLQVLADQPGDLSIPEAKQTIEDLEPDQQAELLALLYIGRGDFDVSEWETAIESAKNNGLESLQQELFSDPESASFLQEGLNQMGYSCEE